MVEKIISLEKLSLGDIKRLCINRNFQKLYSDLDKIGFFSEEPQEEKLNYKKVYTILKTEPDFPYQELGEYICEELFKGKRFVSGKVYNFYLEETYERKKRDLRKLAELILKDKL